MSSGHIQGLVDQLACACGKLNEIRIMEVCGTHTVSIFRTGLRSMLPENLNLISGPGCPVCVTSQGYIEAACKLAQMNDITIATYGDMVRVPGPDGSLADIRARGGDILVVYSIRDAVAYAASNPDRNVVFLAVGFETTTPATAAGILEVKAEGLENFFVLTAHKLVVPAMEALLSDGDVPIDGFLCPGHVSTIIGSDAFSVVAEKYSKPCVVAGFEPESILKGLLNICGQVSEGAARVENAYSAAVGSAGNPKALLMMDRVFTYTDAVWRAIGTIPASGLILREEFSRFDAFKHFDVAEGPDVSPEGCRCGDVIQGKCNPEQCAFFGERCTPISPVGPCMVSSEGTCAAWYKYN